MNIGNQTKITSALSLINEVVTEENAKKHQEKVEIEIFLLQHGLSIENNHPEKILIGQIITLLQRKNQEIKQVLVISNRTNESR